MAGMGQYEDLSWWYRVRFLLHHLGIDILGIQQARAGVPVVQADRVGETRLLEKRLEVAAA
jgi:hypothetical protein